jgi:tetratricopeptide (TPR) repeat protein
LGVRESTLLAIARVLGASLRDIGFSELVERVQAQAERAAHLQVQVTALERQIASLSNVQVRAPAEGALARAVAAFAEGRLDDADREFAALEGLRSAESEAARSAWLDAVDARARLAELRLDYDAAESLRVSAARTEQRAARLSDERQWLFMYEAALSRYRQGEIRGDNAALERAVALYRTEVLPLAPRAERPYDWAQTQNDLGAALLALGDRQPSAARLREAITAFEAALQERSRERSALDWSLTMNNLGNALFRLGIREWRARWFRRSENIFQAALEVISREQYPEEWARTQIHLANAIGALSETERGTARLEQVVQLLRSALEELSREQAPTTWAMAQNNLGAALRVLGQREPGTARLEQALLAFDGALQEATRERATTSWASISGEKADLIVLICERTRDCARLEEAERNLVEAQAALRPGGRGYELRRVSYVLRRIRTTLRMLAP